MRINYIDFDRIFSYKEVALAFEKIRHGYYDSYEQNGVFMKGNMDKVCIENSDEKYTLDFNDTLFTYVGLQMQKYSKSKYGSKEDKLFAYHMPYLFVQAYENGSTVAYEINTYEYKRKLIRRDADELIRDIVVNCLMNEQFVFEDEKKKRTSYLPVDQPRVAVDNKTNRSAWIYNNNDGFLSKILHSFVFKDEGLADMFRSLKQALDPNNSQPYVFDDIIIQRNGITVFERWR